MEAAKRILSAYPDYGRAPPEYLLTFTELLSTFDDETLAALCDLRTGLATRTAYLPTIADIDKFLRARRAEQEDRGRFRMPGPAPSMVTYTQDEYHAMRFYPESADAEKARQRLRALGVDVDKMFRPVHDTSAEHRKQVVIEALGYDPSRGRPPARDLVGKVIPQDSSELKTPPTPPSKELVELVRRQTSGEVGYPDAKVTTGSSS